MGSWIQLLWLRQIEATATRERPTNDNSDKSENVGGNLNLNLSCSQEMPAGRSEAHIKCTWLLRRAPSCYEKEINVPELSTGGTTTG